MRTRLFYTVLILHFSLLVNAQMYGGNVFLQGNYIRLGLTSNGAFGSTVDAPPGFLPPGADAKNSPDCNKNKIGFVADVGKDGWNTGNPPYIGEYFLPGAPEEGWALSFDGKTYNNNRSTEFINVQQNYCNEGTQIPGHFVSLTDFPDRQEAEWQGFINGIEIYKKITLPKNKLYFITNVKLINTNASAAKNVYYMRNVDPDNEVAATANFDTRNKIEYQNPYSGNKALVSARGFKYKSYLGLGTIDCRAKVCIRGGESELANRTPQDVYNGAAPRLSALGDTLDDDVAIALAFRLGSIAPGDSAQFSFAYILSISDLSEGLSRTGIEFNVNGVTHYTGDAVINCTGSSLPINIVNGDDYNWVWSPSNGLNTTTGPSVLYTSTPQGVRYTVSGTSAICTDTKLTLNVYPPNSVISNFITDSACGNKTVTFTNLSPEAQYLWDFGDGTTSTDKHPVHTYATNGSYPVTLTLTVPAAPTCGNILTSTRMVNVKDPPAVSIGYNNNACAGIPLTLTGNATVQTGTVVAHKWTLPGGVILNTQNVTHLFQQPGTFSVLYEATTDGGCKSAVSKKIVVESVPVASFTVQDGCVDKPLSISNQSTNDSGKITGYIWDPGNGSTQTGSMASIKYTGDGNYNLKLTVSTANGCSSSYSRPVNIELNPSNDFSYSSTCINSPVQFTNKTTGPVVNYLWNFDDGTSSTLVNPIHTFTSENNYSITFSGITKNGCSSVPALHIITIARTKPYAGEDTLVFKDTPFRLRAKGGISYSWSPAGPLNNGNIANPVGMLQQDQLFTVTVTDSRGCRDSDQVKVSVFDHDDIYVPSAFTPNNDGRNDVLRVYAPANTVYIFEVFNRWGGKVFSTTDPLKGWDGTHNRIPQPSDVYVWYLKAVTRSGSRAERKGTVMLVR